MEQEKTGQVMPGKGRLAPTRKSPWSPISLQKAALPWWVVREGVGTQAMRDALAMAGIPLTPDFA